jgi:hypothetical protein
VSQMMAILGQHSVAGSRIENGFVNRTLPHFAALARAGYQGLCAQFVLLGPDRHGVFLPYHQRVVDTAVKVRTGGFEGWWSVDELMRDHG